ncbi:hypothetical membrane protein [Thermoplasma acidophilum]|uniref:Hypothetical membrane protein n=1 Tax=Thermoplasma acidophilum (strain ATCC 25905 / DSM 1728 / JCM 9062 / NBRC 15155 / AMRC-C165) TaxID=273075 RepID=Q9HM62_THEAC|nr:hypothetical membrane protein [Thermoplasma acidophilum]
MLCIIYYFRCFLLSLLSSRFQILLISGFQFILGLFQIKRFLLPGFFYDLFLFLLELIDLLICTCFLFLDNPDSLNIIHTHQLQTSTSISAATATLNSMIRFLMIMNFLISFGSFALVISTFFTYFLVPISNHGFLIILSLYLLLYGFKRGEGIPLPLIQGHLYHLRLILKPGYQYILYSVAPSLCSVYLHQQVAQRVLLFHYQNEIVEQLLKPAYGIIYGNRDRHCTVNVR